MIRTLLAAIAGYAVWTILWLGFGMGIAMLFADEFEAWNDGGSLDAVPALVASLAASLVCSLAGGWTTAAVARERSTGASWALAIALLATGAGVQASVWERMPVWYHAAFLLLLIPVTLAGAKLKRRGG